MAVDNDFSISIHAPREGGDSDPDIDIPCTSTISIHAPREGGDLTYLRFRVFWYTFQSTPPARGATGHRPDKVFAGVISIHAPREGGDYT